MTEPEKIGSGAKPIIKGFTVALRDKAYFYLLNDIFIAMNGVQRGLQPKLPKTGHAFLDANYGPTIPLIWEAIVLQYKSFGSSVALPVSKSTVGQSEEELQASEIFTNEKETETLESRFAALFPKTADSVFSATSSYFITFFAKSHSKTMEQDKHLCLEALQRTCLHLAGMKTVSEVEKRQTNPKEVHDAYMMRQSLVGALFSRAATDFVAADSANMRSLLFSRKNKARVQFFDGGRSNSIDGELGGFHGSGLTCLIGGTSGFKTGLMSSLIANHVMRYMNHLDDEPCRVWCYVGEDSAEAYIRRILVNIINRISLTDIAVRDILTQMNRPLTVGSFDNFLESPEFCAFVDTLLEGPMSGIYIVRAPETPEAMAAFSIINVLNAFDSKIASENLKPRFVILDYLNLLKLPRSFAFNNRAEEISSISHILDEWGNLHKIPVVTAAQASADGNVRARELEFYNQEHIHECRSVQHHARMMISILTYDDPTTLDENGRPIDRLALKILKNRDGKKGEIFRSGLDFGKNITLADSEKMSELDWATHTTAIKNAKAAMVEGAIGASPSGGQKAWGSGSQKGGQRPAGSSFVSGGSRPVAPKPLAPKPAAQTVVSTVVSTASASPAGAHKPEIPSVVKAPKTAPVKGSDGLPKNQADNTTELHLDEFSMSE